MGYTTEFEGKIEITPPLNQKEVEYLNKFFETRRMDRKNGPYFVDGTGYAGQGRDADIIDFNKPPEGQPELWCKYEVSEDGSKIYWSGAEKFYSSVEWMEYIIDHFIGFKPLAKKELPFLESHLLHGVLEAQGEEVSDHWFLKVENNIVSESKNNKLKKLDISLLKMNNEEKKVSEEVKKSEFKKRIRSNL